MIHNNGGGKEAVVWSTLFNLFIHLSTPTAFDRAVYQIFTCFESTAVDILDGWTLSSAYYTNISPNSRFFLVFICIFIGFWERNKVLFCFSFSLSVRLFLVGLFSTVNLYQFDFVHIDTFIYRFDFKRGESLYFLHASTLLWLKWMHR